MDCLSVEVDGRPRLDPIMKKTLQDHPETTAVFAATDNFARDVYRVAEELGLRIPEDLSVVGYSDLDFAEYLNPPLTTVHDHPYEMGRQAASIMLQRMQGEVQDNPTVQLLPAKLIERGSTQQVN